MKYSVAGCLTIQEAKEAALCFDAILTSADISCLSQASSGNSEYKTPDYFYDIQEQLLPPPILKKYKARLELPDSRKLNSGMIGDRVFRVGTNRYSDHLFLEGMAKILDLNLDYVVGEFSSFSQETSLNSLTIRGFSTIDVNSLDWEKIIEIRKDSDSIKALRDFRLMFFQDFKDKPISYIEDSLQLRLDRYNATAKSWDAKTHRTSLELLFSHKNIGAIAGFASALSGAPLTSALVAGMSVTIGQIGIHLKTRKAEKLEFMNSDPIRYLSNLADLCNDSANIN